MNSFCNKEKCNFHNFLKSHFITCKKKNLKAERCYEKCEEKVCSVNRSFHHKLFATSSLPDILLQTQLDFALFLSLSRRLKTFYFLKKL